MQKYRTALINFFVLCVFLVGIFWFPADFAEGAVKRAEVKAASLNIRAGPGLEFNISGATKKGASFEVVAQQNGWSKLKVSNNGFGWVKDSYLNFSDSKPSISKTAAAKPKTFGWVNTFLGIVKNSPTTSDDAVSLEKVAVVSGQVVNVRNGPGLTFPKVATAQKGQVLPVTGQSGEWFNVSLADKTKGWVNASLVSIKNAVPTTNSQPDPVSDPSTQEGQGSGSAITNLNGRQLIILDPVVKIRSGAGTSFDVLIKAKAGDKFTIMGQSGDWYQINLSDQKTGWVAKWVTQVRNVTLPSRDNTGDSQQLPIEEDTNSQTENSGDSPGVPTSGNEDQNGSGSSESGFPTSPQKLQRVELTRQGEGEQQLIITGDGVVNYSLTRLDEPNRLVIDLNNVDVNGLTDINGDGTMVNGVRVAQYSPNPMVVRIVIDLAKPVSFVPIVAPGGKILTISLAEPDIRGKIITVDAGHGGYDPGAMGVSGLKEKDFNLETALMLRDKLEALGAKVIVTRSDDSFVSLSERCKIANEAGSNAFVAIHANSSASASTRGTSTYYYTPASVPRLFAQSAQRKIMAELVQTKLKETLGTRDIGILQGNFQVLRDTAMPSILVESAFLSNAEDEELLKDNAFRARVAQGVADGLTEYFTNGIWEDH